MTLVDDIRSLVYRLYWARRTSTTARPSQDGPGGKHRSDTAGRPAVPVGRAGARIYRPPPSHRAR